LLVTKAQTLPVGGLFKPDLVLIDEQGLLLF